MLLSLLSEAVSRAVGQAERDDNATVIGRETNDCDKERRGEEERRGKAGKRRERRERREERRGERREEKRRERREKRREEKRRERERKRKKNVIKQTEVAVDVRYYGLHPGFTG